MGVATTALRLDAVELASAARLRDQLAERDEIIVALQHVIRDLRHELENLRVESAYAAFAQARAPARSSRYLSTPLPR